MEKKDGRRLAPRTQWLFSLFERKHVGLQPDSDATLNMCLFWRIVGFLVFEHSWLARDGERQEQERLLDAMGNIFEVSQCGQGFKHVRSLREIRFLRKLKLLVTSATVVVTGALLVVTKKLLELNQNSKKLFNLINAK